MSDLFVGLCRSRSGMQCCGIAGIPPNLHAKKMLAFLIWSCAPKTGQLNYFKRCNMNKTENGFQDKTFRMASFDNFETNLATQIFFILKAVSGFISVTMLYTIFSAHFISTSSATGYNGNFLRDFSTYCCIQDFMWTAF